MSQRSTYSLLRLATSTPAYSFLSASVAWTIYALSNHPAVHAKLNAEARAFHTDAPTVDEVNGMTYLDYVIREALRLHPPVPYSERIAKEDTVVPLSEPFTDRHGVKRHEIRQVISLMCHALALLNDR
jgi:Cytochrome P450